jgi:hypothetical protein
MARETIELPPDDVILDEPQDIMFAPDDLPRIDVSKLPDQIPRIDVSKLPDQKKSILPKWLTEKKLTPTDVGVIGAGKEVLKETGEGVIGTAEALMTLSSGAILWPFSKAYGLMALPFGAEAAKMAEQEIAGVGYQPYRKGGQAVSGLVEKGIETFLTPTRMATEQIEQFSPEAAYLAGVIGEAAQFGAVHMGAKPVVNMVKAKAKALSQMNKAKKSGAQVIELIRERRANIDKSIIDSEVFIREIERTHTKPELEAIPFIIEKTKAPESLSPEVKAVIEKPSAEVLQTVHKVEKYYKDAHKFLQENWDNVGFAENYVNHVWNIPKNKRSEILSSFTTKNPFIKKRTMPTYEEGIKMGLTPKSTDISYLLRVYDQYKIKTAYNNRFAQDLKKMVGDDGSPLMMRSDKAPVDWVTIDHPAVNRAMAVGKTKKTVETTDTFSQIKDTIEKIKTIERTIPAGESVTAEVSGRIKALEGVMENALEARGMTTGEAGAYLNRLKSAYAGAKITEGKPIEKISETQSKNIRENVFKEIKTKHPIDIPILSKTPVRVHPDIATEVKLVFDKPFSHEAISAYETINAFAKKSMLSVSLFHHLALTESALSSGIGTKAATLWNPAKIYKSLKNKDYAIFKEVPLAKDAIDHGVTFGALEDIQRGKIEKAFENAELRTKEIPVVGKGVKVLRKANTLWDAALWDYYHNSLKLWAYEENVVRSLKSATKTKGAPLTPEEIKNIKREMGNFVNDSFGGQNWEVDRVLGNPKTRQMMQWGLLAPDWTISTLKQATAPAKGLLLSDKVAGKALTQRGAAFWIKAGLYFNLIAQSANYYNSKKYLGEGRFTWENDPGHELNIFAGYNEDGTKKYLRMGKQFREVIEWGENPVRKLGGKLSPTLRETMRQSTAHDPGSGFPTEWAEEDQFYKTLWPRAKSISEMALPFSLRPYVQDRPTSFMFTLPASKGMTNYKTVKLFKEGIKEQSLKKIKHVYFAALENNLNAERLFKTAKSAVKSDITYDNKSIAREIIKELEGLDAQARTDAFELYVKRGIITPEVKKQMSKLIENEQSIQEQKMKFNVK